MLKDTIIDNIVNATAEAKPCRHRRIHEKYCGQFPRKIGKVLRKLGWEFTGERYKITT
jgi:hypothetical protein